jgi:circadian clock protein KaiC
MEDNLIGPISPPRVLTGIDGLDLILEGGLPRGGLYLVEGQPGSAKTTLALQFLMTGVANQEPALLISLSETKGELVTFAASHGWSLADIDIMDLSDLRRIMGAQGKQSVFRSSEVELMEAIELIRTRIAETRPTRIVIDSLSEFRHLAGDDATYRLNMDALKPYLIGDDRTVVMVDTLSAPDTFALQTMVHGVINLSFTAPEVGPYRRQLRIQKLRGVKFREGLHDFEVLTGTVAVYARLVPAVKTDRHSFSQAASGISALDAIVGGGLDHGTSTLIMGPAGSGKSTLATQFAVAAGKRGEKVAMFLFDEHLGTLLARSKGIGMNLAAPMSDGLLTVQAIDPMELSPGKFAHLVQRSVEQGATMIVIDSLTGYMTSMGDQGHLTLQIRNLLSYLAERNVATVLISVQHGLLGATDAQGENLSYIADNVVLLRYYEHRGDVRRALSVFKRRAGPHERTIRDIDFSPNGIRVGPPLAQFRGVLSGEPVLEAGQDHD